MAGAIAPPGLMPLAGGCEAQVFLRSDGNVVKVMRHRPGNAHPALSAVYRHATSEDLSRLEDWLLVRAAARFSDEIEVEYPKLLRLLEEGS
jgi:hypothetical protein